MPGDEERVDVRVHAAPMAELDPVTLYQVLALRSAVFVVEQDCVYLDLDGRDLEPGALLVWAQRDATVLATLRIVREPGGVHRIGRVATAASERGAGLAARVMQRALEITAGADVRLNAQSHLAQWYAGFGFVRDGADFDEDGIPHTPMRLAPRD